MADAEKLSREEIAIAEKVKFWAEQTEYNKRFVRHIKTHSEQLKELRNDAKNVKRDIEDLKKNIEKIKPLIEKINTLQKLEARMDDIETRVNGIQDKLYISSRESKDSIDAKPGMTKFMPIASLALSVIAVVIAIGV